MHYNQTELVPAEKMDKILSEGKNILLTEKFAIVTDYHGAVTAGVTPPIWVDFFQRSREMRKKGSNTVAAHYTTDFQFARYRCCLANSEKGWCISMRALPQKIPALRDDLGLDWNTIKPLTEGSGLTLFAGRMSSGKSTTMAAVIGMLDPMTSMIATVEDPIEVLYPHPSIIQREVGTHVESFPEAIRDCVRQSRGVIVVSEIRDPETANAAIMAASTGHSVFATIHADSAFDVYTRMLSLVDERHEKSLAGTLRGMWWQHIARFGTNDRKPLPIYESLLVDTEVRHILNKGPSAIPMLASAMNNQGRKSMGSIAAGYVARGLASRDEMAEFMQRRNRINE